MKALEAFHMSSPRKILNVTWKNKIPNTEVLHRTKSMAVENIIFRSHLRWLGHLIRMDENRMPNSFSTGSFPWDQDQWASSWSDSGINPSVLKACHINSKELEELAKDRGKWKEACRKGLKRREEDRLKWLDVQRGKRRLRPSSVDTPNHVCDECGRAWYSTAGLASHSRTHKVNTTRSKATNNK